MKTIYKYDVVCKTDGEIDATENSREDARKVKRVFENMYTDKFKIVQHKYVLAESKEVR